MSDKALRSKIIRLAHQKPELREHLLPLVTKTSGLLDSKWKLREVIPRAIEGGAREENPLPQLRVWRWTDDSSGMQKHWLLIAKSSKTVRNALVFEWYRDVSKRDKKLAQTIQWQERTNARNEEHAKQKQLERENFQFQVQVGDFLSASWGYDQTNVNFYQVLKIVGKGTVALREVDKKVVRESGAGMYVIPVANSFKNTKIYKKRLGSDGKSVKINSSIYASKWDGKPEYQTSSYYGH